MKTPVLLLGFNRPGEIRKVIEVIALVRPERIYVACDGPRSTDEAKIVARVHQVVEELISWECERFLLYRESNLGCGRAVSEAITWFFEHESAGIILEDDCLPCVSFFDYCELMLNRYSDDDRVHHVGGCNPLYQQGTSGEYYFSNFNRIWGWATWRESWAHFDLSIRSWPTIRNSLFLENFFSEGVAKYYTRVFDSVYAGEIDTWDYQWFLCRLRLGLATIPAVNLVTNIGFGPNATKTRVSFAPHAFMKLGQFIVSPFEPKSFEPDYALDREWERELLKTTSKFWKFQRFFVGNIRQILDSGFL